MPQLWFERALLSQGWAARDRVTTHGVPRGRAGLSERRGRPDDDFWSWREVMYRFLDRLTPDDIAAITTQAYVELREGGFTRVGEFHYLHNNIDGRRYADPAETAGAIVAAAEAAGIGLTLLPVFYAHSDFQGGPLHIHAAEQVREVDACVAWSGARPVQWLLDNADINQRWCLIHSTHIDQRECAALAASGAVAGLCPVTEANLGDGIFPAIDYLAAGGRFGVGTDSNILIDAAGELRALEYSQRLTHRKRALLVDDAEPSVGATLFAMAQSGGAQALGVTSGLAVGNAADIVSLDRDHPSMAGAGIDLLDRWIFAAGAPAIDSVWRGGKLVVEHGRHVAADAIAKRYRAAVTDLLA